MRVIAPGDKRRQVVSGVVGVYKERRGYKRSEGETRVIAPGDKRRQVASGVVGV